MTEKRQILRSAGVITFITIISRILGYIREQRIAFVLGTTLSADSYYLAYGIPNLFRRLVGEGSLTASFIPIFTQYLTAKSKKEVWEFANRLFWTLAMVLAVMTALGIVFSPYLVRVLTMFSATTTEWELAVHLNRIIFPYLFFIGLAALSMAILNSFHVFGLPAATPILLNLAIIAASFPFFLRYFPEPGVALSLGVLLGGALQFLIQMPQLRERGMTFDFGVSFSHPGIRAVGKLMVPGFFGIGVYQINFLVDRVFATAAKMPEGSLASLNFADRVTELVLGGYAIAVATAILPIMSRQAAERDVTGLKHTLAFSLRIVSFITIPATVGMMVLARPIIEVLFQHGRFTAESTALTSWALFFYATGLPAFAAVKLVVPAFYSTKDTKTPVAVAASAVVVNLLFNGLFYRLFFDFFRNGGPAFATALAAYFNCLILLWVFRRRFGEFAERPMLSSIAKIGLCSAAMGIFCWAMLRVLHFEQFVRLWHRIGIFVFIIGAATGFYLALAWMLRCEELHEVYGIALRRDAAGRGMES